jgi:hypothetical protein
VQVADAGVQATKPVIARVSSAVCFVPFYTHCRCVLAQHTVAAAVDVAPKDSARGWFPVQASMRPNVVENYMQTRQELLLNPQARLVR